LGRFAHWVATLAARNAQVHPSTQHIAARTWGHCQATESTSSAACLADQPVSISSYHHLAKATGRGVSDSINKKWCETPLRQHLFLCCCFLLISTAALEAEARQSHRIGAHSDWCRPTQS